MNSGLTNYNSRANSNQNTLASTPGKFFANRHQRNNSSFNTQTNFFSNKDTALTPNSAF